MNQRAIVAVLAVVISLGCTANLVDCRTSATTAEAKRSCNYSLVANQLEASKVTLLALLESASYAHAKSMISDQEFAEFRAVWSKASEAHNGAVTALALAKQIDSDPWGALAVIGPTFDEVLRIATLLGVR